MNKQETYEFLNAKGITYEITEHKAVFGMKGLTEVEVPYPEYDAKNLFVRDDKKRQYYLITVRGDKRVDLKEFRQANGTRQLTFASAEDLMAILKLIPGAVTPLGLLNDDEKKVKFYLDESFMEENSLIGCHPNDNTATVWIRVKDLISIIEDHGHVVHYIRL